MTNYHPAWERLYLSVNWLSKSNDSLSKRLYNVYFSHLLPLTENDFKTEEERKMFLQIMNHLKELKVCHIEHKLLTRGRRASKIAENIVSLFVIVME